MRANEYAPDTTMPSPEQAIQTLQDSVSPADARIVSLYPQFKLLQAIQKVTKQPDIISKTSGKVWKSHLYTRLLVHCPSRSAGFSYGVNFFHAHLYVVHNRSGTEVNLFMDSISNSGIYIRGPSEAADKAIRRHAKLLLELETMPVVPSTEELQTWVRQYGVSVEID